MMKCRICQGEKALTSTWALWPGPLKAALWEQGQTGNTLEKTKTSLTSPESQMGRRCAPTLTACHR